MGSLPDYVRANGLKGLTETLDKFLDEHDQGGALNTPRYILYQMGNQQSLIRVDIDRIPFRFWYCDLLGRPATMAVKRTVAEFLLDKCGGKKCSKESSHGD